MSSPPESGSGGNTSDPNSWVAQYGDALYRYALLRLRDTGAAEDVVQETFLSALKARKRFAGLSSEKTWLIGILKHKVIDHFRKHKHQHLSEDINSLADQQNRYFDESGHWKNDIEGWSNPDNALDELAFIAILNQCIEALPPRLAQTFILRELEDHDNETLCKALDISTTNNLWVILSRARTQLRACLDKNWFHIEKDND